MLNVGLTGNLAAGKSEVASLFSGWGALVIDADLLARQVQAPGSEVLQAIEKRFGPDVLDARGNLRREQLASIVFGDEDSLASLNSIVHPAVRRRRAELVDEARRAEVEIVVNDIPLLFEALDPHDFDVVVLVDAPEEVRLRRLMAYRHLTREEATRRMRSQMPSSEKRERSTYVIENVGSREDLEDNASNVWKKLLEGAG